MFENPDVDTQPVKHFDRAIPYTYDIKFGMLQVRTNEYSLRKCSGSSAHLRILEGASVARESVQFDNNDSESKYFFLSLSVALIIFPKEK